MQTNSAYNNRFLGAGGPLPQIRNSQSPKPNGNTQPHPPVAPHQPLAAQPLYYTPVLMAPPPLESLSALDLQKPPGILSQLAQKIWFMISEEAPPDRPIGIRQITKNSAKTDSLHPTKNTYFQNGLPTQDYRLNAKI